MLPQARRLRDLKVTEKDLAALTTVDQSVRQIQAPELVEDAVQVEPMVGRTARARRPHADLPEAETLWRADPELSALIGEDGARDVGRDSDGRRESS